MARLPTDTDKQAGTDLEEQSSDADVAAFLERVRTAPNLNAGGGRRGRLIFAMDATASREPSWDQACQIQGEMFEATAALGGLDVQLVFYRGFGECKSSKWTSDSMQLATLMTSVRCRAGRTQVGRILKHAKSETEREKVNALVFVGDSFEEDIDAVCHTAGELGLLGVPAFMFQEGPNPVAEKAFREIARLTNGAYCPFDAGSAQQLKDLLAAVAVYAAGGQKALADYGRRTGGKVLQLTHQMSGRTR